MKKVVVGIAVIASALVSSAAYLNWQVDTVDYVNTDFASADAYKLYAVNSDGYKLIDATDKNTLQQTDVTNYKDYSFYVELANYNSGAYETVARSETVSYADLGNFMATTKLSEVAAAQVWHASNYSAAPEPTSALLVMMGVAFLGLKRRKA